MERMLILSLPILVHCALLQYTDGKLFESRALWVHFRDRESGLAAKLDVLDSMHAETVKRRLTLGKHIVNDAKQRREQLAESVVQHTDLPLIETQVQAALDAVEGASLRTVSRWHGAISVGVPVELVDEFRRRVEALEFVSDVTDDAKRDNHPDVNSTGTTVLSEHDFYGAMYAQIQSLRIDELHERGYNGSGVIVVVLDSGFLYSHSLLRGLAIIEQYDFVDNDTETMSEPGAKANHHGTASLSVLGANLRGEVCAGIVVAVVVVVCAMSRCGTAGCRRGVRGVVSPGAH
jgi:subtilisin family serine protease